MKRTELKRTGPPKRKKGLRKISRKRATLNAIVNPGRKGFLLKYPVCMVCDYRQSVDVHEIARGASREACLRHPELWLCVCRECHTELDDTAKWSPDIQLSIRIKHDISASVYALNDIRGRAQSAVTVADVVSKLLENLHVSLE